MFSDVSGANLRVVKLVQRFPNLGELLDDLRKEWMHSSLIHFDIKWDNVLVVSDGRERQPVLKVVDWELCVWGDPCWDLGSIFTDYLNAWLLSIPITGESPPDRFPELAGIPLARMQPAMASFWRSYAHRAGLDEGARREWRVKSTRYAAAGLLQTVFEQMQPESDLNGTVACSLQLALNMLQRPHEASTHLFGLQPQ